MEKKKIKTFSVDEGTYNSLVSMFKENGAEVSLSYFVDKCLKDLLKYLQTLEAQKKGSEKYTVPMSFIIDTTVRTPIISMLDEIPFPGMTMMDLAGEIDEWQDEYESRKMNVRKEFYRMVKTGKFVLSPDRRYVTNIKTNIKYTLDDHGEIIELVDKP